MQRISELQPIKKRKCYDSYDKIQPAEIAKWGIVCGVRPAARKFGISESMAWGIIKSYKVAKDENEELRELPWKYHAAKIFLPSKLDEKVLQMIKNMRQARCIVNYNIVNAIGKGIVLAKDWTLLKVNDGSLDLGFSWCQSIF